MRIVDLASAGEAATQQAAAILHDALPEGWPTLDEAIAEVRESLTPERISRVAVDDSSVLGWVGGQEHYADHVWELHPLAVRRDVQRRGIGRALVPIWRIGSASEVSTPCFSALTSCVEKQP